MHVQRAEIHAALTRRFDRMHPDDVDDAVAESHIVAWQASQAGTVIANPDAFCTVVAKRHLIRRSHEQQRFIYPDRDESVQWSDVEGAPGMAQEPMTEYLYDAQEVLKEAPAQYADLLRLHYLEGLTFEMIAERLCMSSDCARKRHQRALRWARNHFKDE